jgi:flagellar protein FliO/FliZ
MGVWVSSLQYIVMVFVLLLPTSLSYAQEDVLSVSDSGAASLAGAEPAENSNVVPNQTPAKPINKVFAGNQVGSQLPDQGAYIGQVMMGLVLVLGLIFAIAWVMRRFGQGTLMGGQHMKVVSSLPLGPREKLLLVDVGGEQLLLGVTPGRINCLHNFNTPVVPTEVSSDGSDFSQKLKEILGRTTVK